MGLLEQFFHGLGDGLYSYNFNAFYFGHSFQVAIGNKASGKPHFFCFGNPGFNMADGPDFSGQSHFPKNNGAF